MMSSHQPDKKSARPLPSSASKTLSTSNCRPDLPAAGSERGTQRDLPLTAGSAGQLEVGDIGTGQKQNKNRRAHQHQDELPRADSKIFDGIFDIDSVAGIAPGILFVQARGDCLKVRLCLMYGNAIFQPSEHGQIVIVAVFCCSTIQVERSPNL